ncbi:MAG: amidophosphoribosyltransferase [Euryarchaeota archaeon]|nr:amidophosphoribosyltransferase [Euryarchaeota archaeon]
MCGILGILRNNGLVSNLLYDGLLVLQHRGQDAAGIVVCENERLHLRKDNGLVKDVFQKEHIHSLKGNIGIAHVRYPTAGTSSAAEAQPLYVNHPYGISLAHNGNLTNAENLSKELYLDDLRHINTNSDSEILLNIFADELAKRRKLKIDGDLYLNVDDVFHAVSGVHKRCSGGYAVVGIIAGYGLFAFRDPNGIRPLVYGSTLDNGRRSWGVSSESVALSSLGFEAISDVAPGEAIFIDNGGNIFQRQCAEQSKFSPCIFEYVYFARPDSIIDGISVHQSRLNMGTKLAKQIKKSWPDHDIDVVIPVPDSGRISAIQLAKELGVDYREGLVKNRYIGRTFIMPGQSIRRDSVRKKLNTIDHEFSGKRVLLVDDSIVRGNTSRKIVEMARKSGAKSVYFASAAPPVRFQNVYGIDMPAVSEFIANNNSIDEIAKSIGVDKLFYQSLDDLIDAVKGENDGPQEFDNSCFNGEYVTGDVSNEYLDSLEKNRNDNTKKHTINSDEPIGLHNNV